MAKIVPEDLDLPNTYKPRCLRTPEEDSRPRPVIYYCIYENPNKGRTLMAGPSTNIENMLDMVPGNEDSIAFVTRYNTNGTEDYLYRWMPIKQLWKKLSRRD